MFRRSEISRNYGVAEPSRACRAVGFAAAREGGRGVAFRVADAAGVDADDGLSSRCWNRRDARGILLKKFNSRDSRRGLAFAAG